MREFQITVDALGAIRVMGGSRLLGYSGEHNVAKLIIYFEDIAKSVFSDAQYFRIAIGDYYSDALYSENGELIYLVPYEAVTPPSVYCQIVGYKEEQGEPVKIAKSAVFNMDVKFSMVPKGAFSGKTDVFERTLAACEVAFKGAVEARDQACYFADAAAVSRDESAECSAVAVKKAEECSKDALAAETAATEAKAALGTLGNLATLCDNAANAVKRCIKGSMIAVNDVSPIGHDLIIESDTAPVKELITACEATLEIGDEVSFDGVDNLSVNIVSPASPESFTHVVPLVDGVQVESAKVYIYSGEFMDGLGEINFTISGTKLKWSGWTMSKGSEGTKVELSGSTEVAQGSLITGLVNTGTTVEECPVNITAIAEVSLSEGAVVTVAGGNLMPFFKDGSVGTASGIELSFSDGEMYLNGTATAEVTPTDSLFAEKFALSLPEGKYYLSSFTDDLTGVTICVMDGDGTCVASTAVGASDTVAFSVVSGVTYYIGLGWEFKASAPLVIDNQPLKVMLTAVIPRIYEVCHPWQTVKVGSDGSVNGCKSNGTMLTVFASDGLVSVTYNRDTNRVAEKIDKAPNLFANALKGTKSGTVISIDDVSPVEHDVSVGVRSKNLYPGITSAAYNSPNRSVAFEKTQDGGIKLEGTATDGIVVIKLNIIDLPNGTYSASTTLTGTSPFIGLTDGSYAQTKQPFTVTDTNKVAHCQVRVPNGNTVSGVCYFQIEKSPTVTEYTPYVDVSTVNLGVGGINLYDDTTKEVGKCFATSKFPEIIERAATNLSDYIKVLPNTTLTLNYGLMWAFYDKDKNYIGENSSGAKSATIKSIITVPNNAYYVRFAYHNQPEGDSGSYSNGSDVMAVLGVDLPTEYQPFIKQLEIYAVNADGTVDGVTSLYPNMSLLTDTSGVIIDCEYNRDINKAFAELKNAIINLGGTLNV